MKRKIILTFLILFNLISVSNVLAYTKDEVQKQIREVLSDEEYEIILKEAEASKKSFAEIFDEIIDPKREQEIEESLTKRRYISSSEKNFQDRSKELDDPDSTQTPVEVIETTDEENIPDEEPVKIEEPVIKNKSKLYPGEKKVNDRKLKAKQTGQEFAEPEPKVETDDAQKKEAAKDENKEDDPDNATLKKKRKEIDRKADAFRSYDRKKKIEDYNRTKKKKKFGTKNLNDEVEDKGFETEVFKKKEFGTKVISNRKNKKFDGPADSFEQKGYKRKMLRSGTYSDDDRKTSMFGKDEEEETPEE